MPEAIAIALIGDFNRDVIAHRAIPLALELLSAELGLPIRFDWLHTAKLGLDPENVLSAYHGIWCVPGSPYANSDAAIGAIRFARVTEAPFLGTCGGFQHALLEFAQNVLGMADARHAETEPEARNPLIARLSCSLVQTSGEIHLAPDSRIANAYGCTKIVEEYHCRFGLSRLYRREFEEHELHPVGWDREGDVRAVEYEGHPFFVATLFQPERLALQKTLPPLVRAFGQAVVGLWQ